MLFQNIVPLTSPIILKSNIKTFAPKLRLKF